LLSVKVAALMPGSPGPSAFVSWGGKIIVVIQRYLFQRPAPTSEPATGRE
jgi:hypothetical protein